MVGTGGSDWPSPELWHHLVSVVIPCGAGTDLPFERGTVKPELLMGGAARSLLVSYMRVAEHCMTVNVDREMAKTSRDPICDSMAI